MSHLVVNISNLGDTKLLQAIRTIVLQQNQLRRCVSINKTTQHQCLLVSAAILAYLVMNLPEVYTEVHRQPIHSSLPFVVYGIG